MTIHLQVEGTEILLLDLSEPQHPHAIAALDAAAALELAARLREAAAPLLPQLARCPVTAHDGTRCLGDLGHEGKHWTAAGWFSAEGDVERAR